MRDEDFATAMAFAPCGCETARLAARESDACAVPVLERQAAEQQAAWRCPYGGAPPPDRRPEPLPDAQQGALANLSRLTSMPTVATLQTCPRWYASQPLARAACEARKWAERGESRRTMANALVEAIEILDGAVGAQQEHDHERRMSELKEQRDAMKDRSGR